MILGPETQSGRVDKALFPCYTLAAKESLNSYASPGTDSFL